MQPVGQHDDEQPTRAKKGRPSKTGNLSPEEKLAVSSSIQGQSSWKEAWAAVQENVPGITCDDPNDEKYVPRSTLRAWTRHPGRLTADSETWTQESSRFFSVSVARPRARKVEPQNDKFSSTWLFCSSCGRHRPCGHIGKFLCAENCKPCCDAAAEELLEVPRHFVS